MSKNVADDHHLFCAYYISCMRVRYVVSPCVAAEQHYRKRRYTGWPKKVMIKQIVLKACQ